MSVINITKLVDDYQRQYPQAVEPGSVEAFVAFLALGLVQAAGGKIQIFDNESQTLRDIAAEDLPAAYSYSGATVTVTGIEGGDATLILAADEADDAADTFKIVSKASTNVLQFIQNATVIFHLLSTGQVLAANMNLTCAAGTTAVDLSAGTGTFKTSTGVNTIGGNMLLKTIATPVAATGAAGGVAGAAALGAANIVAVSSDGATKGVKLLTGATGDHKFIINTSSTACNLFAASGGTINGGAGDAGCAIPASKGVLAICTAADTWIVSDFTARSGAAA